MEKQVQIIASDAGGTMTDMIVVDSEGNFTIGKAATTPQDQSLGFWESLADAFDYWGIDFQRGPVTFFPALKLSSTAALPC